MRESHIQDIYKGVPQNQHLWRRREESQSIQKRFLSDWLTPGALELKGLFRDGQVLILSHLFFLLGGIKESMFSNCDTRENSWESLGQQGDEAHHPKGNQPWIFTERTDAEAEATILWPSDAKSQLIGKDLDSGKDWGQKEKGITEDEKVGWHHWHDAISGHEPGQTLGDGDGQGSLGCCSQWDCRFRHNLATEQHQKDCNYYSFQNGHDF